MLRRAACSEGWDNLRPPERLVALRLLSRLWARQIRAGAVHPSSGTCPASRLPHKTSDGCWGARKDLWKIGRTPPLNNLSNIACAEPAQELSQLATASYLRWDMLALLLCSEANLPVAHENYVQRLASALPCGRTHLSAALAAYVDRLSQPLKSVSVSVSDEGELVRAKLLSVDSLQCPPQLLQAHGQPYGCGTKRSCGVHVPPPGSPCVVISVGSANGWAFERGFRRHKHCQIHTLDCTITPHVPAEIKEQVRFHKLCLASDTTVREASATPDRGSLAFVTWRNFTSSIGLTQPPHFFKMDIEGFEYGLLRDMVTDAYMLPLEMMVEIHWGQLNIVKELFSPAQLSARTAGATATITPRQLATFLLDMYREGGYAIVDRNDCLCSDPIYMHALSNVPPDTCKQNLNRSHATEVVFARLGGRISSSGSSIDSGSSLGRESTVDPRRAHPEEPHPQLLNRLDRRISHYNYSSTIPAALGTEILPEPWNRLLGSAINRLLTVPLTTHPYPHLLLPHFFDKALYDAIVEHFPSAHLDAWRYSNETRCTRQKLCRKRTIVGGAFANLDNGWPFPNWHEPYGSAAHSFWRGFYRALNSDAMKLAWLSAFAPIIERRQWGASDSGGPHWGAAAALPRAAASPHVSLYSNKMRDVLASQDLQVSLSFIDLEPGYVLEPHTDVCSKLVSAVLMVPYGDANGSTTGIADAMRGGSPGTILMQANASAPIQEAQCGETRKVFKGYAKVKATPYVHNSLMVFAPCSTSWHAVRANVRRRSIFLQLHYLEKSVRATAKTQHKNREPPQQGTCGRRL